MQSLTIILKCLGSSYNNILERVKAKSVLLKRHPNDLYHNRTHSLKTDEQVLPKEEFLLGVCNSRNAPIGEFSRVANSIIGMYNILNGMMLFVSVINLMSGSNLIKLALPALQEILNRNQTDTTEEEKQVKAARKLASALKAKATRERNKESVIADRVTAALSAQNIVVTENSIITAPTVTSAKAPKKKPNKSKLSELPSSTVVANELQVDNSTNRSTDSTSMKVASSTSKFHDYDKFLCSIDSTKYVWEYITLEDQRSFERQLAKVTPNEENNNITTLAVIIDEDVIQNRRPRDPRFFKVQMFGYKTTHTFPTKYLLVTKSRVTYK